MSNEVRYVRLKPYDPGNGCVVRRYLRKGLAFLTDGETRRPIWYKINDARLLRELAATYQNGQTSGPKLFDILTEAEYLTAVEEEERRRLVQLGVMTTTSAQPITRTHTVDRTAGRGLAIPDEAPGKASAADDAPGDDDSEVGDETSAGTTAAPAPAPVRRRRARGFAAGSEG